MLWSGSVGGAEVLTLSLARELRRLGVDATLVFIGASMPLAARIQRDDVPWRSCGYRRGRDVLRHPRRYAQEIERAGPDGAMLVECGFIGGALRAGGYRAPIIAVEHGSVLEQHPLRSLRGVAWHAARASGAWADDVEVAVSDFVLERMRSVPHAGSLSRIYNGIEPGACPPARSRERPGSGCTILFAARLIPGKGADHAIEALARLRSAGSVRLLIAGEGPERGPLESLARGCGVEARVEFLGLTHEMAALWSAADVALVPSAEFIEACPMTPLEAMAAGRPVVATSNGGLPEIVLDGQTGLLVPPADPDALAAALDCYVGDQSLRDAHGASGRARVEEHFAIERCAVAYLTLFAAIAA